MSENMSENMSAPEPLRAPLSDKLGALAAELRGLSIVLSRLRGRVDYAGGCSGNQLVVDELDAVAVDLGRMVKLASHLSVDTADLAVDASRLEP